MATRIAKQLHMIQGMAATIPVHRYFDGSVQKQLRQFQYQHGLKADGIAGAFTLMRLNDATAVAGPRLNDAITATDLSVNSPKTKD
jgi:murein L,D-transpeptidase YcbB/YkuD